MKIKTLTLCGILLSTALILSWAERFFSVSLMRAFPGVKLGLANIVVTVCMVYLGFWPAFIVGLLRVFILFLIMGNAVSLAFSLTGCIVSLFVTYFALKLPEKHFSLISVSVLSSLAFNLGQGMVSILFFGSSFLYYLPILCTLSLPCGIVTGIAMNGIRKAWPST